MRDRVVLTVVIALSVVVGAVLWLCVTANVPELR